MRVGEHTFAPTFLKPLSVFYIVLNSRGGILLICLLTLTFIHYRHTQYLK